MLKMIFISVLTLAATGVVYFKNRLAAISYERKRSSSR